MAKIAVIGAGYVCLGTCVILAEFGHHVIGVEIDQAKLEQLQAGVSPVYELGLHDLLQNYISAGRPHFTSEYAQAVPDAVFVFICVNTPRLRTAGQRLATCVRPQVP
jgi:UDPglucose 6-dehydrogenase